MSANFNNFSVNGYSGSLMQNLEVNRLSAIETKIDKKISDELNELDEIKKLIDIANKNINDNKIKQLINSKNMQLSLFEYSYSPQQVINFISNPTMPVPSIYMTNPTKATLALKNSPQGESNVGIMNKALLNAKNMTSYNFAVGKNALLNLIENNEETFNIAIGNNTLSSVQKTTNLIGHIAIGREALEQFQGKSDLTDSSNIAIGGGSLTNIITGSSNCVLGTAAGVKLQQGNSNTFIGTFAGQGISNGDSNIMIGYNAGASNSAPIPCNNNIIIGNNITPEPVDNEIIISNNASFNQNLRRDNSIILTSNNIIHFNLPCYQNLPLYNLNETDPTKAPPYSTNNLLGILIPNPTVLNGDLYLTFNTVNNIKYYQLNVYYNLSNASQSSTASVQSADSAVNTVSTSTSTVTSMPEITDSALDNAKVSIDNAINGVPIPQQEAETVKCSIQTQAYQSSWYNYLLELQTYLQTLQSDAQNAVVNAQKVVQDVQDESAAIKAAAENAYQAALNFQSEIQTCAPKLNSDAQNFKNSIITTVNDIYTAVTTQDPNDRITVQNDLNANSSDLQLIISELSNCTAVFQSTANNLKTAVYSADALINPP